jgi:hypothetical protein
LATSLCARLLLDEDDNDKSDKGGADEVFIAASDDTFREDILIFSIGANKP